MAINDRYVIIEIPHQRKARINFYADVGELIDAYLTADPSGELTGDIDAMARFIADDWHGYILLDSSSDLDQIDNYTGHQQCRVHVMRDEISEFLTA